MEKWQEIYKNTIPIGDYQTLLKNSEEFGLHIILESKDNKVIINYGIVSAIRILDEGIAVNGLFNENELLKYKKNNFSNTIYKIDDGEFSKFIKNKSNELYDFLRLNHYLIITLNYVIEIISECDPSIEVYKK